jgi:hypothetical protein
MIKKPSDIKKILEVYKGMNQKQIDKEVDELSNLIYALLIATDNDSIEVFFDRKVKVKMSMSESTELLN